MDRCGSMVYWVEMPASHGPVVHEVEAKRSLLFTCGSSASERACMLGTGRREIEEEPKQLAGDWCHAGVVLQKGAGASWPWVFDLQLADMMELKMLVMKRLLVDGLLLHGDEAMSP